MCGVLEESGASALSSFFGDKSVSSMLANNLHQFETVCENIVEALRPQQNGISSAIKEETVDAAAKAAAAPPQDSGHEAANGESSTAKAEMMEIDGWCVGARVVGKGIPANYYVPTVRINDIYCKIK